MKKLNVDPAKFLTINPRLAERWSYRFTQYSRNCALIVYAAPISHQIYIYIHTYTYIHTYGYRAQPGRIIGTFIKISIPATRVRVFVSRLINR